jgi:hypothetical protein
MYPNVHFLVGNIVTIANVWVTTKDTQPLRRMSLFSFSLLHEVEAQSLLEDLKGGLQTLTNFSWGKSQAESFRATQPPRFPTNPRVTTKLGELKGHMKYGLEDL